MCSGWCNNWVRYITFHLQFRKETEQAPSVWDITEEKTKGKHNGEVGNILMWKERWGEGEKNGHSECYRDLCAWRSDVTVIWWDLVAGTWRRNCDLLVTVKLVSSKRNFSVSRSVWIHLCSSDAGKIHRSDLELSVRLSIYSSIEMNYLSGKNDHQKKYCQMCCHGNRADVMDRNNSERHFLRVTAHLTCLVSYLLRAPDRTHMHSYQQHTHLNLYGSLQIFFTTQICSRKIKPSPCLIEPTYGDVWRSGIHLHTFLTKSLDTDKWIASRDVRFNLIKRAVNTH